MESIENKKIFVSLFSLFSWGPQKENKENKDLFSLFSLFSWSLTRENKENKEKNIFIFFIFLEAPKRK